MTDVLKQKILKATVLPTLVAEHVALTDRGYIKVGLCPFHEERGPSFTVYPDHYHCFGCKESGDAISFVRKILGLGFIDALKFLGAKAGIDTSELDQQNLSRHDREDTQQLFKAMQLAQEHFQANLGKTSAIQDYLRGRGFDEQTFVQYGFGYASDLGRGLTEALLRANVKPHDVEACSLASPSTKNGQLYDFFRNRLMIPIHDVHGRIIAFGGRAMDDFPPKYKNSRDTRLFDKSQTLFGFNKAREAIRKGDQALVVEGYMDTLQLWQQGFAGTTACMGTAFKASHLRLLSNVTNKVFLLFDGDTAGQKASLSSLSAALEFPKLEIRVVVLPPGEDPDTFVNKNGRESLQALISQAGTLLDYVLQQKLMNASELGRAEVLARDLIPWLAQTDDPMRRAILVNKVSFYAGVSRDTLDSEIRRYKPQAASESPRAVATKPTHTPVMRGPAKALDPISFAVLGHYYFSAPAQLDHTDIQGFVQNELELDELYLDFLADCKRALESGHSPDTSDKSQWLSAADQQVLELLDTFSQRRQGFAVPDRNGAIAKLKIEAKLKRRQGSVGQLRQKLNASDPVSTMSILQAIKDLNSEINQLQKQFSAISAPSPGR